MPTDAALQKTRTEADEARLKECREALWRRWEALCRLSQTPGTVEEARDVERALQVRHRVRVAHSVGTHTQHTHTTYTHITHTTHSIFTTCVFATDTTNRPLALAAHAQLTQSLRLRLCGTDARQVFRCL